jgi:hypothetical protein
VFLEVRIIKEFDANGRIERHTVFDQHSDNAQREKLAGPDGRRAGQPAKLNVRQRRGEKEAEATET